MSNLLKNEKKKKKTKVNTSSKRQAINEEKPVVEFKNVTKKYKDKIALNKINFTINAGDRVGIIGANGSGKSTMSEIIAGIRKPTSGQIIIQKDLVIGLQFQESKYPVGITVLDMIKYYLHSFSIQMTESELMALLRTYQISGFENKFIESLSGGQQQRLNILLSVIHNPDLVILDEVSTGLDIEVRAQIFDFLRENIVKKNKTMILVTHMMSEIEEFCEKYIYIHNGVIKDSGQVKDLVEKYGSVHNYTWQMFEKNKKLDLKKQYEEEDKNHSTKLSQLSKNKVDRLVSEDKNYGKVWPLISLMMKYYFKGFFVPFFLIAYPILILFLQGFAFASMDVDPLEKTHSLIGSIGLVQIISVGFFVIPQTIVEFKNSVLMKRIGATNIRPVVFIFAVVLIGFIFNLIAFLWTLLWAGIFFGPKFGWSQVALPVDILPSIPFLFLLIITSISLGMMLASLFRSTTSFIAISNILFLPVAFLSGGFITIEMIMESDILKYTSYINPFKYCFDPFMQAWNHNFVFKPEYYAYIPASLAIIAVFTAVASTKLRWQS